MRLFADTAAWYAIFDRSDSQHTASQRAFRALSNQRVAFFVTDYVIDETLTLLMVRTGHAAAVAFGEWLLRSPLVHLVRIDQDLWNAAWRIFRDYDDKEFSFTDCTSFVVMQQNRLVDAFTFDHHFEQMGFRLWPV